MHVSAAVRSYDICVRTYYMCVLYILSGATVYVCGAAGSGATMYVSAATTYVPALARAGNSSMLLTKPL